MAYKLYGNMRFLPRSDTFENWEAQNPVLGAGEWGAVIGQTAAGDQLDTVQRIKVGDGVTPWNELPWWNGPQGLQGEKGEKGDTGPQGPQGEKGDNADIDLSILSIQNTISGGDKSLTVNDVSSLSHKCSLKLTSDTYKDVVGESNNIFNTTSDNTVIFYIGSAINEDGSISISGYTDYSDGVGSMGLFIVRDLIPNQTYTLSLRSSNNNLIKPGIGGFLPFISENEWISEDAISVDDGKITFTWKEEYTKAQICFEEWEVIRGVEYNVTLYPQLELGDTMTDWGEYGGGIIETKSYIEDFSTVTVSVSGTTYTPNADGTVEDIQSVSPAMEITTDNEHANIIEFTYLVDTKKYIDGKFEELKAELQGG